MLSRLKCHHYELLFLSVGQLTINFCASCMGLPQYNHCHSDIRHDVIKPGLYASDSVLNLIKNMHLKASCTEPVSTSNYKKQLPLSSWQ